MLLLTSAIFAALAGGQTFIPESPKIKAMLAAPQSDRSKAVTNLLSENRTTPIYEADPREPTSTLVTFLWRGEAEVVGVVADFAATWSTHRMIRVEGTDLWYRTYRLPSDSRFYYQIASSDITPGIAEESNWLYSDRVTHGDPLNPLGITIGKDRHFSFAELPKAPKLPVYGRRKVPHGTFEPSRTSSFRLDAGALGKHKAWLYKPANLDPKKPCNLIIFLDGSGRFQLIDSVTMLDNLIADRQLDQTIAIYTDSPNRDRDLTCNREYLDFLIKQLIPWVRDRYRVSFQPGRTVINGASLGGLFAAYAVLARPDVFGGALMQSPSLWWHPSGEPSDWLTRRFAAATKIQGRFFVAPGTFEKTAADQNATGILYSSRWFADVLAAKNAHVKMREVHGGHDPLNWQVSLPEGLLWFFDRATH